MTRLVLVVLVACSGDAPPGVVDPPPRAPPRDAAVTVDAPPPSFVGVLTASQSVDIAPRVAGMIKDVRVGLGDRVAEGQVVVEMDPVQLREELRAAEAAHAAAIAGLRQAQVDLEDARRKLALETKAVERGVSPTQNVDEARLGVRRAEAAVERARSTQAAEAARAATTREHVANASLRAPFAGTVALRTRDPGNRVEAGQTIVRIVGHGGMRLRLALPPQLARDVAIGTIVMASIETVDRPIPATIKQIAPNLDPASGMIFVEAELDRADADSLQAGLGARVMLAPRLD
jgi:RND family efflux transporter MFP subunit